MPQAHLPGCLPGPWSRLTFTLFKALAHFREKLEGRSGGREVRVPCPIYPSVGPSAEARLGVRAAISGREAGDSQGQLLVCTLGLVGGPAAFSDLVLVQR